MNPVQKEVIKSISKHTYESIYFNGACRIQSSTLKKKPKHVNSNKAEFKIERRHWYAIVNFKDDINRSSSSQNDRRLISKMVCNEKPK